MCDMNENNNTLTDIAPYTNPIKGSNENELLSFLCKRKSKILFRTKEEYKFIKMLVKNIKKDDTGRFRVVKHDFDSMNTLHILKDSYSAICIGVAEKNNEWYELIVRVDDSHVPNGYPSIVFNQLSLITRYMIMIERSEHIIIRFPTSMYFFHGDYKAWIKTLNKSVCRNTIIQYGKG